MSLIPKGAIERAIEGGWTGTIKYLERTYIMSFPHGGRATGQRMVQSFVALDPSFWQALAKALGGRLGPTHTYTRETINGSGKYVTATRQWRRNSRNWKRDARRFYDLILTGADTKAFWDELLRV